MFARFDENPAMTLQVIKKTKRYGQTDARMDNVKTVLPTTNKVCGGYNNSVQLTIVIPKERFQGHSFGIRTLHRLGREVIRSMLLWV